MQPELELAYTIMTTLSFIISCTRLEASFSRLLEGRKFRIIYFGHQHWQISKHVSSSSEFLFYFVHFNIINISNGYFRARYEVDFPKFVRLLFPVLEAPARLVCGSGLFLLGRFVSSSSSSSS